MHPVYTQLWWKVWSWFLTGRKPPSERSQQAIFKQAAPERSEYMVQISAAATGGEIFQKESQSEMPGCCAVPKICQFAAD